MDFGHRKVRKLKLEEIKRIFFKSQKLCCKSKNRLSRVVNYNDRVVITKIGKEYDTEGIIMIMEHLQDGPLVHPVMAHKFNICIKS